MKQAKTFILLIIAIVILFDFYLLFADKETISNVVYVKTKEFPIFIYLTCFLLGHLFWPNNPRCPKCLKDIE